MHFFQKKIVEIASAGASVCFWRLRPWNLALRFPQCYPVHFLKCNSFRLLYSLLLWDCATQHLHFYWSGNDTRLLLLYFQIDSESVKEINNFANNNCNTW